MRSRDDLAGSSFLCPFDSRPWRYLFLRLQVFLLDFVRRDPADHDQRADGVGRPFLAFGPLGIQIAQ
jgi:hypothetical protein